MRNKNFFYFIAIPFLAILCVQLCLANSSTRDVFTNIETVEGVSYDYVSARNKVYVELKLISGMPSSDIIIFYNTREVIRFTEKAVRIPVDCDGTFQIQNNTGKELIIDAKSKKAESVSVVCHNIPEGITTFCFVDI